MLQPEQTLDRYHLPSHPRRPHRIVVNRALQPPLMQLQRRDAAVHHQRPVEVEQLPGLRVGGAQVEEEVPPDLPVLGDVVDADPVAELGGGGPVRLGADVRPAVRAVVAAEGAGAAPPMAE